MNNLTGFQRDLVYTIAGMEEPHGLAIKEEIQDYREETINHGRLYPNLDTLVDQGYVDKGEKDRRTNSYTLTPFAWEEISSRSEWVDKNIKQNPGPAKASD